LLTNPDVVIRIVELFDLAEEAELRIKPELDCPFSEARQPPYIHEGNPEQLSNISEISKRLSSMSQRKIQKSYFSEQHDKSDDKSKRNE